MATKTTRTPRKVKEAKPEENGSSSIVETEQGENGIAEKPEKSDGDGDNGGGQQRAKSQHIQGTATLDLAGLKDMSISELTGIAKELGVEGASGMRKQELIFKVLAAQTEKSGLIFSEGVLETLPDGFGFLARAGIQLSAGSRRHLRFAVADSQIRSAHRRHVSGQIRPPKEGERYFALIKVEAINFEAPEAVARKSLFRQSDAALPGRAAEDGNRRRTHLAARVIDLVTPIGKGQRA
jgi:transcription termination factor Rho